MPSNVNPLVPTEGVATTASVRDNFLRAKTEIEALQTALDEEISNRSLADLDAIAVAANAATAALTAYSNDVNNALSDLNTAIGTEATARINADSGEQSARIAGDAASYADYTALIGAESSARIDADATELTDRATAVYNEEVARIAADGTLSDRILILETEDPWHAIGATGEPAFLSDAANLLGGWPTCAFRKTRDGMVIFRGLFTWPSCYPWGIFLVMPVGYRPGGNVLHTGLMSGVPGMIAAMPSGAISAVVDCASYSSLDPLTYFAEL